MWLAVRSDLALSHGKLATQAGHAFQHLTIVALERIPAVMAAYLAAATPKITVRADNEAALRRIEAEAMRAGVPAYLVCDAGRTEIEPGTPTVVAFGPAYREDLPPYLKRLRLLSDPLALDGRE